MKLAIQFPNVSPAVTTGTIARWHRQVGDAVSFGDDLFDVAVANVAIIPKKGLVAKARGFVRSKVRDVPGVTVLYRVTSMDTGTLATITAPEGTTISVGESAGEIDTNDGSQGLAEARTSFDVVRANEGMDA